MSTRDAATCRDEACDGTCRHVDDDRPGLGEVKEADDVGRGCVGGEDAALADEVVVDDDVAGPGAEGISCAFCQLAMPTIGRPRGSACVARWKSRSSYSLAIVASFG